MISLTTRPLAWGGKVWAHTYNDVLELVSPGFHMFTVTNMQLCGKVEGSNEQDSSNHSIATNR